MPFFANAAAGTTGQAAAPPEPTPDYIPEAAEPSEAVWAREQALYRDKQDQPGTEH